MILLAEAPLTDALSDLDHGRGLLDDLLELVHDVLVRVVDPRPRYDDAPQLRVTDTFSLSVLG